MSATVHQLRETELEYAEERRDLAAAFRWAARLNLNEGVWNHFSLAFPGEPDRFLVNSNRLHWSEITASNLLVAHADGTVEENRKKLSRTGHAIHSRIHLARPDKRCIFHVHSPNITALACAMGGRVEPVHQSALRFANRINHDDDYHGHANDIAEGVRMAAALGDRDVLFLANHGVIVLGDSVAQAFNDLYYLERTASLQVKAMSTGLRLKPVAKDVIDFTAGQFAELRPNSGRGFLASIRRILDREAPDYAY